ncbi:ligand-binding sensor domain-containing diguanylate cyclase [Pelomonas sp. SE-A7]|uniref:ligand-binding sensor domain-containing diguanylate cyclase n=1 Tax=Pelomonas sp. SE-A7 TaxID=3054953 RepID=UPI00259CFF97|nr:ligand-binding sensor domain-containing diguanylate cyclase [Pelomonas sp. SE-A7]MDM4768153.1 two-component regulator propeller domain-containing protein [Pelomonas sp. SE-A7]
MSKPAPAFLAVRSWLRALPSCAAVLGLAMLALAPASAVQPAAPRWSQLTELSFRHLRQDDGLPNEIATAVAEDGAGFLWIGSLGGLARWDGYRFRIYQTDSKHAGALPDSYVQMLHGDRKGRLWVGTQGSGLARYEPTTDSFISYPVGPNGLAHVSVRAVVEDGQGALWVASEGGLDHLDPDTGRIRRVLPTTGADAPGSRIWTVLQDRRAGLWIGTERGLFHRAAGAVRFQAVALPVSGRQPEPQAIYEDSAGRLWIGTLQHGAFLIEPGAAEASRLEAEFAGQPPLSVQQVVTINEVRPGEVWLGTLSHGIVAVDAASRRSRAVQHKPALSVSLADNSVRALYRDRSGLLWVATNRGLSRHDPGQRAVLTMYGTPACQQVHCREVSLSNEVSWILPTADGRIWLGTHKRGVEIIDPTGARVAWLKPDEARPEQALPQDIVVALEQASDGTVFIGTKRGLYRANGDGSQVRRVKIEGRDPASSSWALLADGDTLWIGGQSDGLWSLDLRSGKARSVLPEPARQLSDQRIFTLARGPANSLWIGTRMGLNRFFPASGRVQRIVPEASRPDSLAGGFITSLYTDRQQRLWVGTYGAGISILESSSEPLRFRHIGKEQGLANENINALLEDRAGLVWASTDSGLARIDPATLQAQGLRRAEGVEFMNYWTGSAANTGAGELLFGGSGGMSIVRPDQFQRWSYRPPVVLTALRLGEQWLDQGRLAEVSAQVLELPADATSLVAEVAALDYSAPERNRYAHKLENFDRQWIEMEPGQRQFGYNNLPPGKYRLLLRGANRDGVWTEKELALNVRVLPAWHQTWWFRGLLVLMALAGVAGVVQLRTRWLRLREQQLSRLVAERTAELERLSAALAQKSRVLERASISDPLTGLHNRRFLAEHIDTALAASLRRAREARLHEAAPPPDCDTLFFLIDVDHFKRVNDQYGHAAGDAVLVQFGRRLQQLMRESDYVVRWGGEEFLAVARDTDRGRAAELAERIRCVVGDTPFELDDGRLLRVNCSIGFACMPFVADKPKALGWQDAVKLADQALLGAKRSGRNAWVGLLATATTPDFRLPEHLQSGLHALLWAGQLELLSNKPPVLVSAALAPDAAQQSGEER